jgi:hypothetical protein
MMKETMEVVAGVDAILDATKSALADGTVGWTDIPKFVMAVPAAKRALEGITLVPAEVENASKEDLQALVLALGNTLDKVIGIFTSQAAK